MPRLSRTRAPRPSEPPTSLALNLRCENHPRNARTSATRNRRAHHPPAHPHRARLLPAWRLAALLLAAFAALLALPLQAQAQTILVSNTGQDNSGARTVGSFDFAAVFGTGSNTAGYDLDSIVLSLGNAPTGTGTLTLTVREDASGDPSGTVLYTLTNPGTVQGNSLNTFAAPADATLDADSTYWVVMSYSDNSGGPNWWRMNLSDGIDSGGATGWTIDTPYKVDSRTSPDGWSEQSNSRTMKLQIKGTAKTGTLSTDATLSGLALQDASDNSAITLSPTFVSGTTSYTASEANDVDEITVLPTVNESNATYEIQDGDGTALVDADSATGFQVDLSEGENTVKVEVTAEDSNTTETYTVVVTRLRRVTTTPAAPPEIAVPNDWSLIPTGLGAGDQFRLLFLSSTKTNGESYDIADYNTFIQGRAAAGHTDIRTYSSGFRALGCTPDSDATANTATTGTGVVIHWLNGNKVADDYADFYDGNWDEESNSQDKNELGTNGPNTSQSTNYPFTGCDDDGTEDVDGGTSYALGESQVRVARPGSSAGNAGPLTSNSDTAKANTRPMYGLSQVFEVAAAGNTSASGAPAITGAAQVDKVLTAGLGTIADAEGLPGTFPDDYTFQWVRVDADGVSNPTNKGTDSSTYTVVVGDVGKKIFVEVSFTDGGGTLEDPLPSAAYPSNAPVAAAAGACLADNDWCTTLTVGLRDYGFQQLYGYSTSITDGVLADTTIDDGDGTTWTVSTMQFVDSPVNDAVNITLDAYVPHGTVFDLDGTTLTANAASEQPTTGAYTWSVFLPAGFAWVHGQDVTVSVKLPENAPATGASEISGTPQVGETLTAGIGDIADLDGLPTTFPDDYTLQWIRVDANGTSNPVDVGTDDEEYTLVAADEGKRIKVKATFTDDAGNAEERTSDAYLPSSHRAYPDFGIMPAQTACPSDNDWCATMTVGYDNDLATGLYYGFSASPSHGALDDTSFEHDGSTFTVEAVGIRQPTSTYHVRLHLDAFVPQGSVFELNGYEFTADADAEQSSAGHYRWAFPAGFRIAEGVDYRVSLKLAEAGNTLATGKPSITGTAPQVGNDADGRSGRHRRHRRLDHSRLHLPVDPWGERHRRGDGNELHAELGRLRSEDPGAGGFHGRRRLHGDAGQRRDAAGRAGRRRLSERRRDGLVHHADRGTKTGGG